MTRPVVARGSAAVSEACAYAVQAICTIFGSITSLEGGVLPALVLLCSACWPRWIGLNTAALIRPARELTVRLPTSYVPSSIIAGCGGDIIEFALRAAAIAVHKIAVVAGLTTMDNAITTLVMATIRMLWCESAPTS